MTRASPSRLERKGIISPLSPKYKLSPQQVIELAEMIRIVNARQFEAKQIKGNTALVPRGQEIAKEIEAIAVLLENAKNLWVQQRLIERGYPHGTQCSINLSTGEILPK